MASSVRRGLWWIPACAAMACHADPASTIASTVRSHAEARGAPLPRLLPDPGPFRLPHTFEPRAYRVAISLDPDRAGFGGAVEIDADVSEPLSAIWLDAEDLDVSAAQATNASKTVSLRIGLADGRIALFPDAPLPAGRWHVAIAYSGKVEAPMPPDPPAKPDANGNWPQLRHPMGVFRRVVGINTFWFTNNEPIGARHIFPCVDEPDRKVPWQLTLDVPEGDVALANAPLAHDAKLDAHRHRFAFAPTLPVPSYLVAFAVGPFQRVDGGTTKHGTPVQVAITHGDLAHAKRFAMTAARVLDVLDDWFEIPYAYDKLDLVWVPELNEAMENPGLVTFDAGWFERCNCDLSVIAHELAHQWFGDLVTPKWWDDIWLNEDFAAWMAEKVALDPDRVAAGDPARAVSINIGAMRVRVSPRDLSDDAFFGLIDRSGGHVIDAIERYVGPEPFRRAIHEYMVAHANATVTSEDFISAIGEVAGPHVATTITRLLTDTLETFELKVVCDGGKPGLDVHVYGNGPPTTVCYAYDRDGKRADACSELSRDERIALAARSCPSWFVADPAAATLAGLHSPPVTELAVPWLTDVERRRLLAADPEPRLEAALVHYMLEHDGSASMDEAADPVIRARAILPADLRAALDQWLVKTVVPRAGHGAFDKPEQAPLDELLALAGDTERRLRAVEIAGSSGSIDLSIIAAINVVSLIDPAARIKLLHDSPSPRDWILERALRTLPDSLALLIDHADEPAAGLMFRDVAVSVCDPALRAREEELFAESSRGISRRIDSCLQRRAALEPAYRAWLLGKAAPAKPTPAAAP